MFPVANSIQAKKRVRQNKKRALHNVSQRSAVRTAIKKILKNFKANNVSAFQNSYQHVVRVLDRAASRRIIHPNKAARLKSRLSRKLKHLHYEKGP